MLLNNLDREVAEQPEELVVYGGSGQGGAHPRGAARDRPLAARRSATTRRCSSRAASRSASSARTRGAPRVLIANSLLVPRWATWDEFRRLEALGLTMFGQMTAGQLDLHRHAGDPAGHVPDVRRRGRDSTSARPTCAGGRSSPPGSAGWAARSRSRRRWPARRSSASRSIPTRIERRLETRYLDEATDSLDDALARVRAAAARGPRAVGRRCSGTRPRSCPSSRGAASTSTSSPTRPRRTIRSPATCPAGLDVEEAAALRARDPDEYLRRARESIARHVEGMLEYVRPGSYVFDYGNNLRGEAHEAGVEDAFTYPGFVPAYIRPLFCRGIGPFRWAALSGDPADIAAIDGRCCELFPDDALLQRWLELAPERVAFQGLPARICWLGYGDRARAGLAINELVRSGEVTAPVVIGRDHLDSGSVASPYRETEAMRDGSDAIADWPILNALLNVAAGATWVSVHHGGGVGIGNSIHAGMVVVADGTDDAAERLERVLTTDPGTGVMRHADAGYDEALDGRRGARARPADAALARREPAAGGCSSATSRSSRPPAGRAAPLRGRGARRGRGRRGRVRALRGRRGSRRSGRMRDLGALDGDVEELDGARALRDPGPRRLPHARVLRAATASRSSRCAPAARPTRSCTRPAAGSSRPSARRARPARTGSRAAVERHRGLDAARRHDDVRGEVGLRARPRDRARVAARDRARPAASRPGSARTRCRRSSTTPTRTSTSRSPRCCPRRRELAEAADVFLERGAFDAAQARRYLEACRDGRARAAPARRPVHRGGRDPARDRARRALGRPPRGDRRRRRRARSRRATSPACCCPASALFLGRPMPPARALVDAGAAIALATDFNPGSAFCESLPLVCSLACTQLDLSPAEALVGLHGQRGARPRARRPQRPARAGLRRRPRAARRARLALPRLPPRRRPGRRPWSSRAVAWASDPR